MSEAETNDVELDEEGLPIEGSNRWIAPLDGDICGHGNPADGLLRLDSLFRKCERPEI